MRTLQLKTFAFLCLISLSGFCQSHFKHTIDSLTQRSRIPAAARDFWFAVPLNYDPNDISEKYFTIYISSIEPATVNIQISGQAAVKKRISAGEVWDYMLPKAVELKGSSTIEKDKAIHVWSDDGEISVYFMSRNPFTSDGFMVIPTLFWDTSYVVASYSALLIDPKFDLPSEFCIVADQNNTMITIVPSQDVRRADDPAKVLFKKDTPFTVILQRGESIQYQTVFDLGGSDLDLTGTVVTSTKPIGVIGASVCPFIPADPYCDHINEMLLPVSRWGRAYHTLPFAERRVGGDSFLLIASKDGQVIYRNGNLYATIDKFEIYFRPDIDEPSEWTSAAPFMLVQYINSSRYGSSNQNQGDPAMLQVNPAEFAKTNLIIQTPSIVPGSNQNPFTNYINILFPKAALASLRYDGSPLPQDTTVKQFSILGSAWGGIRIRRASIGAHTISCDSPITACAYGYAREDSYAWSVLGPDVPIVLAKDSIPPLFTITDSCNCATVNLSAGANRIKVIRADSLAKLSFEVDPSFDSLGKKSAYYKLCGDSLKGVAIITAIDNFGNSVTINSTYVPQLSMHVPDSIIEFTVEPGAIYCRTITIFNLTGDTLQRSPAYFLGEGWVVTEPNLPNNELPPLPPYGSISLLLCFSADSLGVALDTFVYSYDSCTINYVILKATVEPARGVDERVLGVSFHAMNSLMRDRVVRFAWNSPYPSTIELYDMLGRLQLSKTLTPSIDSMTEELLLPKNLAAGSYILRYSSGGYAKSQVMQMTE